MLLSTKIVNVVNDVRSIYENKRTCTPLENIDCLEHTDAPSVNGDGTVIPVRKEIESVSVQSEDHGTSSGIGHMLHGSNDDKTEMTDGIEKSEAAEMSLVQKHGMDSSKSMTDEQVDLNKEAGDVAHTVQHDETESKDGENWEMKENPYQEGIIEPSLKVMHTGDDSTNKESGTICNGNLLEDERPLAMEEPKVVSPRQVENINEDEACCIGHEDKVIEDENPFEKENELDEKDSCISAKEDGSDLNNKTLPMMCHSLDSIKEDCIINCNREPLDEQLPQTDSTKDVCNDLELRRVCKNGSALTDEHAISDKASDTPSGMDPILNEPTADPNSETYICLVDKTHFKKTALSMSDESTCSLEGSYADGSIPQTKDNVETGSQSEAKTNFSFGQSSDDHEDQDTKSIEGEEKADSTTQKDPFHQQSPLPQCEVIQKCEAEVAMAEETDQNRDRTNEGLEKIDSGVVIPFIGMDISGEDILQPYVSHAQGKVEEAVQGQKEIPFISETTFPKAILPTEVYCTSQMYSKDAELSSQNISLLDVSETIQPVILGSEFDDRCPTPTMDEIPYKYIPCSSNSSTSAFSGSETCKNITQKYLSRSATPIKVEMPLEQKHCHTSTVDSDHNPLLHPDVKLRTLRVLQSIDTFLSKTSLTDKSSQNETADMKNSLDQTPNPSSKYIPSCLAPVHIATEVMDKKISNTKPAVVPASTSQELSTESSDHSVISPFRSKLEEVLGVKLKLKKTDSTVHQQFFENIGKLQETSVRQDYCQPYRSPPSTGSLQAMKPNIDQDKHKTSSQTQLTHEPRSYSKRPVMAVKPSKSDESQADFISIEGQIENSAKNKWTKIPVVTCTIPTSMLLERKTESFKGYPERPSDDKQEASELSSKSYWLSDINDRKSNSDRAKFALQDLSCQYQGTGISKISSSSTSMQSFESAKCSSKLVYGNQHLLTYSSVEKVGQTTKDTIEMDQKDCSDALASFVDYKDDNRTDDSLVLEPPSSLVCTVYNTSQKKSYSLLEQLSQRCLQDDLTQASMEQECLIFSEQMKQLLKRSKGGPICQQDTHDKFKFPCITPVTVHFSSLEEQEDSVDHLDALSFVGQRIMVDMSDRKGLADTTEEEKTLHPSQATGNPLEHAGVSGVTAEYAALYEAMMNNACVGTKVLSRHKSFRMDRIHPKTEPSSHFDFCGQMKRKMDESFRSNLNSVVKKSCRTKYRFYILATSDDVFFEETKVRQVFNKHLMQYF